SVREKLDADDQRFIVQTTREIIENLEELNPNPSPHALPEPGVTPPVRIRILGFPVRDAADELSLLMLERLLDPKRFEVQVISSEKLFSEMIAVIRENPPEVICVAALTPDPIVPLRRLCKRLRDSFQDLRLIACRWGPQQAGASHQEQLIAAGADFSGTSL